MLDDELSTTENPLVKSATCFLQQNMNVKDFIASLPTDLQVLVILYGGEKENITSECYDFDQKFLTLKPLNSSTYK